MERDRAIGPELQPPRLGGLGIGGFRCARRTYSPNLIITLSTRCPKSGTRRMLTRYPPERRYRVYERSAVATPQQVSLPPLAHALKDERRRRRWRQVDLASHLGVTQQTVARWEAGDPPQRRLHDGLAEFLGVTSAEMLQMLATPLQPGSRARLISLDLRRGLSSAGQASGDPQSDETDFDASSREAFSSAVLARIKTGEPLREGEIALFRMLAAQVGLHF